jgi:arylsulfatase A-like enzyme
MHGSSLYMPSLHVPLLIRFPARVPAGRSVPQPVSLRDLPATVVDLLELQGPALFPGASLARYWNNRNGDEPVADPLLSGISFTPYLPARFPVSKGDMKSLVENDKHYIKNADGREELYHFVNDPAEEHDLVGSEATQPLLQRLRLQLGLILGRQ